MGMIRRTAKGTAAVAIGLGILAVTPVTVFADGKANFHSNAHDNLHINIHANVHENDHANSNTQSNFDSNFNSDFNNSNHGNDHSNVHENIHVNIHSNGHDKEKGNAHINAHENVHVNIHSNEHDKEKGNAHSNVHESVHVNIHNNEHDKAKGNDHRNVHENVHVNLHSNEHTKVEGNEHVNVHVNVHDEVSLAAVQLEQSLYGLQCDSVDYLYAYLQSVHLNEHEVIQIKENCNAIEKLFLNVHETGHVNLHLRDESWRIFIRTMNLMHLNCVFVGSSGQHVDIFTYTGSAPVTCHLQDKTGYTLANIQVTPTKETAPQIVTRAKCVSQVATADYKLTQTGHFVPAPAAKLPRTATNEPLWIAIGALTMFLGGLLMIPALRRSNKR